jgi:hypothetical protein
MRGGLILAPALLVSLAAPVAARADEIRLKDGTKISGTIVGFENDSFRVETSFGFALIRKDKVADINIAAAKEPELKEQKAKPASAPEPPPSAAPAIDSAVVKQPASSRESSGSAASLTAMHAPVNPAAAPAAAQNTAAKPEMAPPKVKTVAAEMPPAPAVAAPVAPPPPPEPPVIHDEIRGGLYVNETYGFQMFRPPSWDLIPAARKALPDAVAALGTSDQTTLLVIGRTTAKDSLEAHANATERALKDVYENYRLLSTRTLTVGGVPAIEQRSRGTADGRDWSVILLTLLKDNAAYTLLGMTWANSDLIQVQENVIAKTVGSFSFMKP